MICSLCDRMSKSNPCSHCDSTLRNSSAYGIPREWLLKWERKIIDRAIDLSWGRWKIIHLSDGDQVIFNFTGYTGK